MNDTLAKRGIKRTHLKLNRRNIYTALANVEEIDWHWSVKDVLAFDMFWGSDISLGDIARYFKRSEYDVLLLALDRLAREKIKPREGWRIW